MFRDFRNHPGSFQKLAKHGGQDATRFFNAITVHRGRADEYLAKYLIGIVKSAGKKDGL